MPLKYQYLTTLTYVTIYYQNPTSKIFMEAGFRIISSRVHILRWHINRHTLCVKRSQQVMHLNITLNIYAVRKYTIIIKELFGCNILLLLSVALNVCMWITRRLPSMSLFVEASSRVLAFIPQLMWTVAGILDCIIGGGTCINTCYLHDGEVSFLQDCHE
jgi:hypothetical protein